jgi:hypothetical protein
MAKDDMRLDREDGRKHEQRPEDDSGGRVKAESPRVRMDRLSGLGKPETMLQEFRAKFSKETA